jgi:tRNA pseudouridine38-40 synthase
MKRVMLIIAYDGTRYCGWQIQDNGITVEGVVTDALRELLGEDISLIGASRTDSGVHADGNVAVFDTGTRIPADKICFALNKMLPDDIVIRDSFEVRQEFHPRHVNSRKAYEYSIRNSRFTLPCDRLYTYHVHKTLDTDAMREAAAFLVGEHDFTSFCSLQTETLTKVRTVFSLDIEKRGDIIRIRITGNGFLYNMVRIITGTLVQAGLHAMEPTKIKDILEAKDRSCAGPTAPACGLKLVGIEYDKKDLFEDTP